MCNFSAREGLGKGDVFFLNQFHVKCLEQADMCAKA